MFFSSSTIYYLFSSDANFGLYKSYPLNRNLVLEICKEEDTTNLACSLDFSF
jgi:hypothetical protein